MGEGRSGSTCSRCCSLYRDDIQSNTTLPCPVLPYEISFTGFRENNVTWLQLVASYPTVNSTDIFLQCM